MIEKFSILMLCILCAIIFFASPQFSQAQTTAKDPLERLMDEYIANGNLAQLEELRQLIDLQVEGDPENPKGYFLSGKLEKALGNPEKAIEIWKKALTLKNKYPRIYKSLAEEYLEAGDGDRFTETYYTWLENETDTRALNMEFELSELAMPFEIKQEFSGLEIIERKTELLEYWRKADPYPITVMNERLVAHEKRIQYALGHFGAQYGNLGFDDRGKVYIRYGEPELKYDMRRMYEFPVRKNESWYYPSYGLYMAFDFVDAGGGFYREVNSLMEAIPGRGTIEQVQELYAERTELGGVYAMGEVQTPAGYMRDIPQEKRRAQRTIDPKFEIALDMLPLEYEYRIAQFRGEDGNTRVEIAFGVPLRQLKKPEGEGSDAALNFRVDVVLRDGEYKRSQNLSDEIRLPVPAIEDFKDKNFIGDERYETKPGTYEQSLQVLEMRNKRGKFLTHALSVRDFSGRDFTISDLKFSQSMGEREFESVRAGEELDPLPFPFSTLQRNRAVWLYFELYNLMLEPGGGAKYRISMRIFPVKKDGSVFLKPIRGLGKLFGGKREFIETIQDREGSERAAKEYFQLDMSKVAKGDSRLMVMVEDLLGESAASDSIDFELK